ncbi:MAG: hypothetical protein PHP54_02940 [Clostridia bacterium]|nr:hypothetical protein [Clostridia bacterium]
MLKQKAFNYLTLVLAIVTLYTAIFAINTQKDMIICTAMLVLTIICYLISNKFNKQSTKLSKKDREAIKVNTYVSKPNSNTRRVGNKRRK